MYLVINFLDLVADLSLKLSNGEAYRVDVRQQDASGNYSDILALSFTYDKVIGAINLVNSDSLQDNNLISDDEFTLSVSDADTDSSVKFEYSADGGTTWDTTGIQFPVPSNKMVNKLIIHPTFTDSIFAATDERIMISPDGGQTWSMAQNTSGSNLIGRFRDIEFKPNNPNVLYAVKQTNGSSEVFKSTDRGLTWFSSNNGIGLVNRNRPLIAVTPVMELATV